MRLLAIMDWQHVGKPDRPSDRGAAFDVDGDGVIGRYETEAGAVARYWLEAQAWAADRKIDVIPMADGRYSDRHARANSYAAAWRSSSSRAGRVAYLACHANAGAGRYGALFYDARSRGGLALAGALAGELRKLEELGDTRVIACGPGDRPFTTIAGVYSGAPVGVCLEPGFLDGPEHRALWTPDGAERLGRAIAAGLDAWRES